MTLLPLFSPQLEAFRHIKTEEGHEMVDNYRPVQNEADPHGHLPPHAGEHRTVYYNNPKDAYTAETVELGKSAKYSKSGAAANAATLVSVLPFAFAFGRRPRL
jgi:hypothetical protein